MEENLVASGTQLFNNLLEGRMYIDVDQSYPKKTCVVVCFCSYFFSFFL